MDRHCEAQHRSKARLLLLMSTPFEILILQTHIFFFFSWYTEYCMQQSNKQYQLHNKFNSPGMIILFSFEYMMTGACLCANKISNDFSTPIFHLSCLCNLKKFKSPTLVAFHSFLLALPDKILLIYWFGYCDLKPQTIFTLNVNEITLSIQSVINSCMLQLLMQSEYLLQFCIITVEAYL